MAKGLRKECLEVVSKVLGRQLTKKEGEDIAQAVRAKVVRYKRTEPNLTKAEYIAKAARELATEINGEADRLVRNAKLQISAVARSRNLTQHWRDSGIDANSASLRFLDTVNSHVVGLKNTFKSELIDLISASSPKFFGFVENKEAQRLLVKAICGEEIDQASTKLDVSEIQKAADIWKKWSEENRQRYNRAGGDIGFLEDWTMPQSHSQYKVINAQRIINNGAIVNELKASAEFVRDKTGIVGMKVDSQANKTAWVEFTFPLLKRSEYLDDNFQPKSDADIKKMLGDIWETLVSEGDNKLDALTEGPKRGVSKADQRRNHRAIHFKDADSRIKYNEMFGQNPSILGTLFDHVDGMARDITLLEDMGPSPTVTVNTVAREAGILIKQGQKDAGRVKNPSSMMFNAMWAQLNGTTGTIEGEALASVGRAARSMQVFGKLGSATLSSLSDFATYFHSARFNKIPALQAAKKLALAMNPTDASDVRFAARAGIVGDIINSALSRFAEGNLRAGIMDKLASATLKLSLLPKLTDAVRRAASFETMSRFAEAKNYQWYQIDGWLRVRMENFGLTEELWKVIQLSEPEELKGAKYITKNSILKLTDDQLSQLKIPRERLKKLASDYLAFVMNDAYMASLEPDLYTRAITTAGFKKGTWTGETWTSFMLFKSFPIGMISKHVQRSGDLYRYVKSTDGTVWATASRVGYATSLIVSTTLVAWVANMFKDIVNGSDIKDPFSTDAIMRAFASGGGAGFMGDILVSALDDYKYGHQAVLNLLGPVFSTILDAYTIFDKYKDNKDIGANVIRLAKGNLPLVNLWYTKQLLNHAVFNQIQEMMNPGYHRRIEQKIRKNQGVGYWWKPTDMLPYRMPEIGTEPRR